MTFQDCYQETDSKIIYSFDQPRSVSAQPRDETIGDFLDTYFSLFPEGSSLTEAAWSVIRQAENSEVAKEAEKLVTAIQRVIITLEHIGVELNYLPLLKGFNTDDGAILLEWTSSEFRVGFSIEVNPDDSGWYLVSNKRLGDISASGFLPDEDVDKIALWLFNFVIAHT